jgi:hypothetical protein
MILIVVQGLLAGLILCVYKLKNIVEELNSVQTQSRLTAATETKEQQTKLNKQLNSLEEKRAKQIQGIVKNGIDLIIPSARLGWLPVSDGTVGLAGSITSIIGIIDTWPKQ